MRLLLTIISIIVIAVNLYYGFVNSRQLYAEHKYIRLLIFGGCIKLSNIKIVCFVIGAMLIDRCEKIGLGVVLKRIFDDYP